MGTPEEYWGSARGKEQGMVKMAAIVSHLDGKGTVSANWHCLRGHCE